MNFIATIQATYEAVADAENVRALLAEISPDLDVKRVASELNIRYVWPGGSKYGAARPASSAIHDVFDAIADDEYYRPWPIALRLSVAAEG